MLDRLFGSRLRARALGWLMTHPDQRFFVRELTTLLHENSTNLSRELARLAEMGILTCRQEGRQKYYEANPRCPVFKELQGLAVKTVGIGDVLRKALEQLSDRIRVASLFGSFADGRQNARSDIDLLVIGDVSLGQVATAIRLAEGTLGREVNVVVYPPAEFAAKARDGNHFITQVLEGAKVYLIGDEDDLGRIARQGQHPSA